MAAVGRRSGSWCDALRHCCGPLETVIVPLPGFPKAYRTLGGALLHPCPSCIPVYKFSAPRCRRAGRDLGPIACSALLHACAQDRDLKLAWQLFDDMQAAKVCINLCVS